MDLRQIKTFMAVAQSRNFTRAAEALCLAQPAVSISVAKLEEELGLTLFNRQGRQVSLTAEGETFLRHAQRIFADLSNAEREMSELRELSCGEVRVGIPPMMSSYYFPRVIHAFRAAYPKLQLSVMGEGAGRIQQLIRGGEIDLGVIAGSRIPEGLEARCFLREEVVACVPVDHPFARRDSIRLEELWSEPLILFKQGYYMREWIDSLLRDLPRRPTVVFETNLFSLVRSLIREGVGLSTLLRMVVADEPQVAAVSFSPPLYLDLHIAWKSDGYLSRANQAFRDFLIHRIESYT
ncbi:MAG: LysR family transcriptional regulator [Desulfuromonadaceae bacterium]|nr:LysR family transcriptional regulator [Desulfuromonadaceae bacterium]